jgi:head-tail adaptor
VDLRLMQPFEAKHERCTFQRPTVARGGLGVVQESAWADLGSRFCAVRFGSSAERREAAVERATQGATFRCIADALVRDVKVTDRIVHAGLTWDIVGLAPIGHGPREIEFTAVAARG